MLQIRWLNIYDVTLPSQQQHPSLVIWALWRGLLACLKQNMDKRMSIVNNTQMGCGIHNA